jgi:phage repressor protein C with HTH and peptisase S24 domain
MEPKYHDGDILLVEETESVDIGELGIFILDGNGYFKKYGGDRLISLNEEYGDILLKDYAEAVCCGRVVGKLKRR